MDRGVVSLCWCVVFVSWQGSTCTRIRKTGLHMCDGVAGKWITVVSWISALGRYSTYHTLQLIGQFITFFSKRSFGRSDFLRGLNTTVKSRHHFNRVLDPVTWMRLGCGWSELKLRLRTKTMVITSLIRGYSMSYRVRHVVYFLPESLFFFSFVRDFVTGIFFISYTCCSE